MGIAVIQKDANADNDNPQYQTLEDCNSLCDEPKPGGCGSLVLHEDYVLLYSPNRQISAGLLRTVVTCQRFPLQVKELRPTLTTTFIGYEGTDVAAAKSTANYETYGVLYNWPAVMTEGICPSGWHIPSDEEFTQLTDFLGGERCSRR